MSTYAEKKKKEKLYKDHLTEKEQPNKKGFRQINLNRHKHITETIERAQRRDTGFQIGNY